MIGRAVQAEKEANNVSIYEKQAIDDAMKYIDMKYQHSVKTNAGYFVLEESLISPALKCRNDVYQYFNKMGYKVFWVKTVNYYIIAWNKEVAKEFEKRQNWWNFYMNLSGYTISETCQKILKIMAMLMLLAVQVYLIEGDFSMATTWVTGIAFFGISGFICELK